MGFLPEVKVGGECVLEHVNDEVAHKDPNESRVRQFQAFRHHFEEDRTQHEARTQGYEVTEGRQGPAMRSDDRATDHVGDGSDKCEDKSEDRRRHFDNRIRIPDVSATVADGDDVPVLDFVLLSFQAE